MSKVVEEEEESVGRWGGESWNGQSLMRKSDVNQYTRPTFSSSFPSSSYRKTLAGPMEAMFYYVRRFSLRMWSVGTVFNSIERPYWQYRPDGRIGHMGRIGCIGRIGVCALRGFGTTI